MGICKRLLEFEDLDDLQASMEFREQFCVHAMDFAGAYALDYPGVFDYLLRKRFLFERDQLPGTSLSADKKRRTNPWVIEELIEHRRLLSTFERYLVMYRSDDDHPDGDVSTPPASAKGFGVFKLMDLQPGDEQPGYTPDLSDVSVSLPLLGAFAQR